MVITCIGKRTIGVVSCHSGHFSSSSLSLSLSSSLSSPTATASWSVALLKLFSDRLLDGKLLPTGDLNKGQEMQISLEGVR